MGLMLTLEVHHQKINRPWLMDLQNVQYDIDMDPLKPEHCQINPLTKSISLLANYPIMMP